MTGWVVRDMVARTGGFHVGPVDLELTPGRATAVVGRSGAGKTTLLRGLAGLAPVERGVVSRGDETITDAPPEARRIGYVPQGLGLFPHRTVYRNIAYPIELRQGDVRGTVGPLLERFGLTTLAGRRPHELSAGEQQRVAIARALAAGPELLLWDEPLSALDVEARDDLLAALGETIRRDRLPLVLVTHDPVVAFTVADRLLVLDRGQVVHSGDAFPLYERPSDPFVARFVGFENVFTREELTARSTEDFSKWLLGHSGPAGVAFRASSVRVPQEGSPAGWPARVVRVAPGPDGFTLHAEVGTLTVRMRWRTDGSSRRPPTDILFGLDDVALSPIANGSGSEGPR
ncbi:MAG: ABC transporter ATP-binding protein [Thermoplasmata archaeon]|nr:ABC transporter ATP-binding protein [Thermoplasmata archaeon]